MEEKPENTFAYWRKLLQVEEAKADKAFLQRLKSPLRLLRPLFYFTFNFLMHTFYRIEARGAENVPKEGAFILAPNHNSAADGPFVLFSLPKKQRESIYTITTKTYYDRLFTRVFIQAATNAVRIDTEKDFFPALRVGAKILLAGKSTIIFPEGDWSLDGRLKPFKVGIGVLAFECNVPIVPIYIKGTREIMPPFAMFPQKTGKVEVSFGKPIYRDRFTSLAGQEQPYYIYKKITNELREAIIKLGACE